MCRFPTLVGDWGADVLTAEEKLDQALEDTFPASDAFWLGPGAPATPEDPEQTKARKCEQPGDRPF